ncbi:MAG: glycosyltransferase [Prevotella sp.]|nr:glycosyltransferase [Prevotella sp.]
MQTQQSTSQDKKPLVSFVVTYYNLPVEWLRRCIDSILALPLTDTEREIIVVDDGSDDSPMKVIAEYGDHLIYLWEKNGGLSVARNKGISVATGQYLQFVDADDFLIKEPYGHCLDIARHQSPDMVIFDFTDDDTQQPAFTTSAPESGSHYLRHHNIRATAWGYLFKKSCLSELRFTDRIYHEDEEFTPLLLLRADTVVTTDAKAYCYQKRADSIMTSQEPKNVQKRLDDTRDVILRLNATADTLPAPEHKAMQRRVAQLTMDYIYNIICQTRDRQQLSGRIAELRANGLFPLPDRKYTKKYTWFRRMSSNRAGLALLFHILPALKKER